ncbi:MAG TPA: hypothetical protein VFN25_15060, partial [Dokdonella sp.]|nr:hypothetical protein [Dokdonella sp.]
YARSRLVVSWRFQRNRRAQAGVSQLRMEFSLQLGAHQLRVCAAAGRLHTQSGLMDELSKIRRVLAKIDNSTPHEVLMVIDGTTGQNAIAQLKHFREAIGVSGLVVTKLDGTAKGGVVFALAREFGLPIRFIGLGEGIEDLRVFDAQAFVDGLLPASLANASAGN